MTDNDLIDALASDLRPVGRHRTEQDLALAVAAGGAVSIAIMLIIFGVQPGLAGSAMGPLVLKLAYALAIAGVGSVAALRLSRPATPLHAVTPPLILLVAALAGLAAVQLFGLDQNDMVARIAGGSWQWCTLRIVALAIPIFAALIVMLRRQAPLRTERAGAAAGLVAGALSAALYAFACVEQSAAFVLIWYTLGIVATSALGWLLGPRLLRW